MMASDDHVRRMKKDADETSARGFSKDHLKAFIERVERLNSEIKELNGDKRDIYAEAVATGFSKRAMQRVIKVRSYEQEHGRDARMSEEAIFDTYMNALGML